MNRDRHERGRTVGSRRDRDPTRFFVLTAANTGSSLLAAILADAGADFGMPAPASWDPRHWAMESREMQRAVRHLRRGYDIDRGRRYKLLPFHEATLRRGLGKRCLRRALQRARFVKLGDLDLAVQPASKLGYRPRLVLVYRRFAAHAIGSLTGTAHKGPDELAEDYARVYRQGIALMHCFGGCVVSFHELTDPVCGTWAQALAELTGLAAAHLREARDARLAALPDEEPDMALYPEPGEVFAELERLRGRVFAPSRQALRAREGSD